MNWVCEIRVDATEDEIHDMVSDLRARFGERVRTTTKAAWLVEVEREPPAPFREKPVQVFPGVHARRPTKKRNL